MTSMDVHERPHRINSERTSESQKKGRKKLRMTVWFSKENYSFLKENYGGRISEIMDAFATFLRTNQPITIEIFKIGNFEEWARPDSNRRSPPRKGGVITARPRALGPDTSGLLQVNF